MTGDATPARRRPLYRGTADTKLVSTTIGNAGLWYDKFCDCWNADWNSLGDSGKRDWIADIANQDGTAAKRVGDRELLGETAARQRDLAKKLGGRTVPLATVWRFVSGLGRSHPVENGFAWHHALGVPYLPGSSVKGLVRAWAMRWVYDSGSQDNAPPIEVTRLFSTEEQGSVAIGSVIFLDALPVAPVALDADVMTPHYAPWYQEEKAPGDWHSPTPIPFLTVAPGQTFQFALLPRTPADTEDCERAATLLRDALETLGAGAKTAAGYGVFGELAATAPAKPAVKAESPREIESRVRSIEDEELGTVTKISGDRVWVRLDSEDDAIELDIEKVQWL